MLALSDQLSKIITPQICDAEPYARAVKRLQEGALTRDENPQTHFCVYFLPYNQRENKVFFVHHKKANMWVSPGGHIDKGEDLLQTLNREIWEELGVKDFFKAMPAPFLLTIVDISNQRHACHEHFDIWFLVKTDGSDFHVDPAEFHDTRWMPIEEADQFITEPNNRRALEVLKKMV